jgi:aspartokinase-like uncharacterized kinase
MKPLVIKLTGAVLQHPRCQEWLEAMASMPHLVVVCGGGQRADQVRSHQQHEHFSDQQAHYQAIGSMVDNAHQLHQLAPALTECDSLNQLAHASQSQSCLWLPRDLLGGHPEVEEHWGVTSDSLAIWCAGKLEARACLLVKAGDPPPGLPDALAWSQLGYVDEAFPRYAKTAGAPWQAVGVNPEASCSSILQRFSEQH